LREAAACLRRAALIRLAHERLRLQHMAATLVRLQGGSWLAARHARVAVLGDRLNRSTRRRIDERARLKREEGRLASGMQALLQRRRQRAAASYRHLAAMDPHSVLNRGYSMTTDRDGNLIRSAAKVQAGQVISTRVPDGSFESVIATAPSALSRRRPRRENDDASKERAPGLFDFDSELRQTIASP